ncbi:MAG TPA: hypothetical protein VJS92_10860, partial [Candidatus Polarisedimenticolaceae bacterium]|nr:hypothetical protein [Candidatus Polarisedimenticolaceae bacterium]
EIRAPDACWERALRGLLPRLAGRLAARAPELGVRRFKICAAGQTGVAAEPVPEATGGAEEESREGPVPPDAPPTLAELAERYLAAAASNRKGTLSDRRRPARSTTSTRTR